MIWARVFAIATGYQNVAIACQTAATTAAPSGPLSWLKNAPGLRDAICLIYALVSFYALVALDIVLLQRRPRPPPA